MAKRSKLFTLVAKEENQPGTWSEPTVEDALQAINPQYTTDQEFPEVEHSQPSLDPQFDTPGQSNDKCSFQLELRGSGEVQDFMGFQAPARMPRFARLMQGCGFRVTNALRIQCTDLTVGLRPGSMIYGQLSGGH